MASSAVPSGLIRFDGFEADLRTGELHKDGVKVRLEGQPFQVLAMLLRRPGQLVTREELQKELWPGETFVDFEQGINAAVKRLRLALEDSADTPRFIETLPRRGYRFIAKIENGARPSLSLVGPGQSLGPDPPAGGVPVGEAPSGRTATRPGMTRRRPVLIASAAVLACVLLFLSLNPGGWRDRMLGRPAAGTITSIVVLPLENLTGNPQEEYFVDGMTEELITELGKISSLRVISRTSAMAFKGAKKPLPEIARQLGVDAVLEGAVLRNGDRIRITARVMHLSEERILWADSLERDLRDISSLQHQIVLVVADEIKMKLLDQERAHLAQARRVHPRAYEAYLMGRFLQARRNQEDMRKAFGYFQHALEIDPSYVPAYVGIVDCYSIGGGRHMGVTIKEADAKMREAARRIVELDADSAAGHYAQAMVKWHDWDFPAAESEFRRALELDPGNVQMRQHYSHFLMSVRRPDDARREVEHALALDPLSSMLTVDMGHAYSYSRRYAEAIQEGQKALSMDKDSRYARMMLISAYWSSGQYEKALELGWPNPFQPEKNRRAKEIFARAGVAPLILAFAREAEQQHSTGDFYSRSSWVALWYARAMDREKALAWLEKAYAEHDPWLPMDLASPNLDVLGNDPRYQDLLRRMGLPR